jgi:hypothetical protein
MTQSKVRFASFEEYLTWSNDPENYMEGRYELVAGELVELMPESERDILPHQLQAVWSGLLASQSRYCVGLHELYLESTG